MSKKRPPRESRPVPAQWQRRLLLAAVIAGAPAAFLTAYLLRGQSSPVPDPDRSAMEPQVSAKIEASRRAVLNARRSHEAWGRLGIVLQAHRLQKEAALCYQSALELAPGEFRWRYLIAHALRDTDPQAALAEAEAASKLRPDYSPTYVLQGQLLEQTNAADLALLQYQKAASLDPASAPAEFGLGRLYLARGGLEESLRHLLRARDLSEDAGAIHGSLAQVYRRRGDREASLRENRLASELMGSIAINDPIHYAMRQESLSSTAKLERAISADRAGDYEKAEALYRELVELRPDDADIHAKFGDTLARQSKLQPAKDQYLAALTINPRLAPAHYGLGNMLNFERDYAGAANHYRAALKTRPEHIPTLVNLGSLLAFQGKLGEAASIFREALEFEPKAFGPNRQLADLLVRQNRYKEAIPHLEAALESHPDSGPVHLSLGIALASTGDYRSASSEIEKARELGQSVPPRMQEELRARAK